jgi:hypothetical protein
MTESICCTTAASKPYDRTYDKAYDSTRHIYAYAVKFARSPSAAELHGVLLGGLSHLRQKKRTVI